MASFLLGFLVIFATSWMVQASDPDILSDFIVPPNVNAPDGNFFTFIGLRGVSDSTPPNFKVTKASKVEFSALDGQSVSMAMLQYAAGGVNPPHTHPRAAELLFVLEGSLQVGFVDTTNKLSKRGIFSCFQRDWCTISTLLIPKNLAIAVSAFGSANAGTASLPTNLFASGVDDTVLAKSFKTDVATIQKLKAGLALLHPRPSLNHPVDSQNVIVLSLILFH